MRMLLVASAFALLAFAVPQHARAAAQAFEVPAPGQAFGDNCAACHQADGKGISGAFPALAGDPFVTGPVDQPLSVVLNGRAGMPAFRDSLTGAQIAAALTFARMSWGNRASPVTSAMVEAARAKSPAPGPDETALQAH